MKLRRLWAIVLKEVRQLRRDRITLAMIVMIPVGQLVLFGYAINLNPRGLTAAVADQAGTAASRALVMDMVATGVVRTVAEADTPQQLVGMLRRGEISVGIAVPPDFERRRVDGREVAQVMVDGSDTVVQSAAAQLAQTPVDSSVAAPRKTAPIGVVAFYNPQRRSPVNIVPGLIGVILTMTMVMFTSVAIVRERERGNMELLITTPVSRTELMIGKVLPYALIGLIQTSVVLLLGLWLFDVPIKGSVLEVYIAAVLLILANLALGLMISTKAASQFQAMQMTVFILLPSILLSGFMFPFRGMPDWAQGLGSVIPVTHFLRVVRGALLKGLDVAQLWPSLSALGVFVLAVSALAMARYRTTLD